MYNTNLCCLESGRKWLILHRVIKKNSINEGKYVGVDGKFLEGESPEEYAARGVFEETSYTLTRYRYTGIVTFVSDHYEAERMHLFLAGGFAGEYRNTEEDASSWVPKEEVLKLPLWEGGRISLPLLQRSIPFFSLKLCYEGDTLTATKLNDSLLPL